MKVNRNFCRPTHGGTAYEFAPVVLPPNPHEPTESEYNAAGWYRNGIEPPSPPEGKIVTSTRYAISDNKCIAVYEYEDRQYTLSDYDEAMEAHLQTEREARGYTTREPDAYLASSNPRWKQDAEDWVAHRDAVMVYALEIINAVQQGLREPPTMDEFKAGLPVIEWSIAEEVGA